MLGELTDSGPSLDVFFLNNSVANLLLINYVRKCILRELKYL